ncbi:3' terminal RNA ribose 2'-O-methyltransferase Hen1 [Nocardia albiluteola]|uniref:3' terminal RNA ribose 2'-O-methyltransferase Hen1 n=1 Tax=Nocardia albiluteola TaxID=2842303 RepID=UPI0027E1E9BB|nr:3' terminal RNA ribose 2'-O-methyltransferase Hen1 [Nocardia albiluteola]
MLLTITCTRAEGAEWVATDLGFLLHKNPARVQMFEQSYGSAQVLYPEATEQRCTAALLLEIDPVGLVRGKSRGTAEFSLGQYVNDRPYAASSLLSVAISTVFKTALHGKCEQRPGLADTALPLRLELPVVSCKGGPEVAERIFGPLGWRVAATPIPLDPAFPEWGESHYVRLELTADMRLADALSHLYVLLPVLDGSKHYWLAADEIDKLLRAGVGWLAGHPERAWITRRYLARKQSFVRSALARLAEIDDATAESLDAVDDADIDDVDDAGVGDVGVGEVGADAAAAGYAGAGPAETGDTDADETGTSGAAVGWTGVGEAAAGDAGACDAGAGNTGVGGAAAGEAVADDAARPSLAVARRAAVVRALHDVGARRVLDLGCGEGALLRELLRDKEFSEIVGVDVSMRALRTAHRRLRLDRAPKRVVERITLRQGALTYADAALRGYDAAVLMEVIEHVDPPRLTALGRAVFGAAAPNAVIVTTPNGEYNVLYEGLPAGKFRHTDHRFEWSRAEFDDWARRVAETYGYSVRFGPIGPTDPDLGSPTQLAVFEKSATSSGPTATHTSEKGAAS